MVEEGVSMDRFFEILNAVSTSSHGIQYNTVEKCNKIVLITLP
jgi:hypothetical protein